MQPSVRSIDSLGIAFAPVYIALVSQIDLHPLRPCPGFSRPKPKPPKISKDFLFKDVNSSKAARSESKEKRVTRSTLAVYLFTFSGANGDPYFGLISTNSSIWSKNVSVDTGSVLFFLFFVNFFFFIILFILIVRKLGASGNIDIMLLGGEPNLDVLSIIN